MTPPSKRNWVHLRLLCVAVSIGSLWFLLHRIRAEALAATFHSLLPGELAAAVLLFGALFLPAALRWRIALQANDVGISIPAAFRLSLIGHFCYTILFGVAGGDTAKSVLYSRWQGLPLATVLAASSLDRLLGFAGTIIFSGLAFVIAATHGSLTALGSISLRWPATWLVAFAAALVLAAVWLRRSPPASPQICFLRTLAGSGQRLMRSPRNLFFGIGCAVAVQAALSGALALCLAAVSPQPLPWVKLMWVFPLITLVSALPITFAGLGVRDSASVALLGLFHVPASAAVAASLLAAGINVIWALAGAGWLWREAARNNSEWHFKDFKTSENRHVRDSAPFS